MYIFIRSTVRFVVRNFGLLLIGLALILFIFRGSQPVSHGFAIGTSSILGVMIMFMSVADAYSEKRNPLIKRLMKGDVLVGFLLIIAYMAMASGLFN